MKPCCYYLLAACLWMASEARGREVNVTIDDVDDAIRYSPPEAWSAVDGDQTYHEAKSSGNGGDRGPSRLYEEDEYTTVSFELSFTGTAVYLFCLQPLGSSEGDDDYILDLQFVLDDNSSFRIPGFFNDSSQASSPGLVQDLNVLALRGLSNAEHVLTVGVADESSILFDYVVLTQTAPDPSPSAEEQEGAISTTTATPMPTVSSSDDTSSSKHNVATFAGAIGGSVGVLGCLALGIFISIYRRRRRAARREQLESALSNPPEGPRMVGPRPFIPRYFPGTLPAVPPPYTPSPPRTSIESLNGLSGSLAEARQQEREPMVRQQADPDRDPVPQYDEEHPPTFMQAIGESAPESSSSTLTSARTDDESHTSEAESSQSSEVDSSQPLSQVPDPDPSREVPRSLSDGDRPQRPESSS